MKHLKLFPALLVIVPTLIVLMIWLSPLAFAPVPWPDDSAFYFVAHEFFKWPPRWVMLPQAPFEPTYRIFNFNTMPLYPILIGLGRFVGIDGSFAIKFWPLGAWLASAILLPLWLFRRGLPGFGALLLALAFSLDPALRWSSLVVRPESLIGLLGVIMVLGITLGFSKRWELSSKSHHLWDPVALLLALGAYAHFNAVHLLFPVVIAYWSQPKRLVRIATRTALYLSPWALTVLWYPKLFIQQMTTQWRRLEVHNDWLSSPERALKSMFPDMGNPEPYAPALMWASGLLWVLLVAAVLTGLILLGLQLWRGIPALRKGLPLPTSSRFSLTPAFGWVAGALWVWHSKPELWFIAYLHFALWTFGGLVALYLWKYARRSPVEKALLGIFGGQVSAMVAIFLYTNVFQYQNLNQTHTWHWPMYREFVGCVNERLTQLHRELGQPEKFRVWAPTFPDITIELSRQHPSWEFTRTNDFWDRRFLAMQHGRDVEAVVVTETLQWPERFIAGPADQHPREFGSSVWMNWKDYFLNHLYTEPAWKPNRYLCQKGRWMAFMFMKDPKPEHAIPSDI